MNRDVQLAAILFTVAGWVGCGKTDSPTTAPSPATRPAMQPSPAVLDIGGEPIEFAITHLIVTRDQDSMYVQVYGMDRGPNPQSSFDFSFSVEGNDPSALSGQVCRLQTASDVDVNEASGVSLANDTIHMLPKALRAEFSGTYPDLTVTLTGLMAREGNESQDIKLHGTFIVRAEEKRGR